MPPAARVTDPVSHLLPPVLGPGPGSPTTLIGFLPAWRGMPLAAAAGIQAAQKAADVAMKVAESATKAAIGPAAPVAFAAAGADIHICATPVPVPPHGPGVVINGSATVLIDFLPATRQGNTVLEALGGPNKIAKGEPTVIIGG